MRAIFGLTLVNAQFVRLHTSAIIKCVHSNIFDILENVRVYAMAFDVSTTNIIENFITFG